MSDLQRSFAKAKLAALPFQPPLPPGQEEQEQEQEQEQNQEEDEDEENEKDHGDDFADWRPSPDSAQDDDSSSASSTSSTGTIIPSPSKNLFARPK